MRTSTPILLSVTVLFIASLACGMPTIAISQPNEGVALTAIMQTMIPALTQTAQAVVPVDLPELPVATFTPETPTLTPTATLSPTPVFTNTPLVPQVSVSQATNCRIGPGKVYDRVGALMVGQVAEVVGRDSTGAYWYIHNPTRSNGYCWIWGQYATVSGNFAVLPVLTPPPTPTPVPAFEAAYDGKDTCVGWWVEIELSNTGGLPFKSIALTVRDTVTDAVVSLYSDSFTNIDGCLESHTKDVLDPGVSRVISSPAFAYDPVGHELRATITLCSSPGQNGMCVTQVIKFTP